MGIRYRISTPLPAQQVVALLRAKTDPEDRWFSRLPLAGRVTDTTFAIRLHKSFRYNVVSQYCGIVRQNDSLTTLDGEVRPTSQLNITSWLFVISGIAIVLWDVVGSIQKDASFGNLTFLGIIAGFLWLPWQIVSRRQGKRLIEMLDVLIRQEEHVNGRTHR